MSSRVVIDDQLLWRILRHPLYQSEFPFLRQAAAALAGTKEGCGSCARAARRVVDFQQIKRALARMPDDRKLRFKELLQVDQVEIIYADEQGRTVKLRF